MGLHTLNCTAVGSFRTRGTRPIGMGQQKNRTSLSRHAGCEGVKGPECSISTISAASPARKQFSLPKLRVWRLNSVDWTPFVDNVSISSYDLTMCVCFSLGFLKNISDSGLLFAYH